MKLFKKFASVLLAITLIISLATSVPVFASQFPVQEQQQPLGKESRIAMGSFNFSSSTKNTVKLHGLGFDTGDVSTITGSVKVKVGTLSKSYSFEGTVPGLYSKTFGSWYLLGWKTATLEYYYINYSDGSKSTKIIPEGITVDNNY